MLFEYGSTYNKSIPDRYKEINERLVADAIQLQWLNASVLRVAELERGESVIVKYYRAYKHMKTQRILKNLT